MWGLRCGSQPLTEPQRLAGLHILSACSIAQHSVFGEDLAWVTLHYVSSDHYAQIGICSCWVLSRGWVCSFSFFGAKQKKWVAGVIASKGCLCSSGRQVGCIGGKSPGCSQTFSALPKVSASRMTPPPKLSILCGAIIYLSAALLWSQRL